MQVSTTCRSTVKRWIAEACGSIRIRSHSGRKPGQRAGLLERLPHGEQPGPEASRPHQRSGPPPATASGSGAHSRTRRAAVAGASTTSRSAASAAARSSRTGSVGRPGPRVEHHLAADERHARGDRLQGRTARAADRRGPGQHRVDAPPGQPGEVGDPAAELAHVELGRPASASPSRVGQGRPQLGRDPVGRPPGGVVEQVADVEQRWPAPLQLGVRDVDQPGRASALSTVASRRPPSASLMSGTDTCASSPITSCRASTISRSAGSRVRASRATGEHRRCAAAG